MCLCLKTPVVVAVACANCYSLYVAERKKIINRTNLSRCQRSSPFFSQVYTAAIPLPPPRAPRVQYVWSITGGGINDASTSFSSVYLCFDTASNAASDTHPTLVTAWGCAEDGQTSSFTTDTPFSLTCGCSTDEEGSTDDNDEELPTDDNNGGDSTDDNDGGSAVGSTNAAAGGSGNSAVFSVAGKVFMGLVTSILGSVVFV